MKFASCHLPQQHTFQKHNNNEEISICYIQIQKTYDCSIKNTRKNTTKHSRYLHIFLTQYIPLTMLKTEAIQEIAKGTSYRERQI